MVYSGGRRGRLQSGHSLCLQLFSVVPVRESQLSAPVTQAHQSVGIERSPQKHNFFT